MEIILLILVTINILISGTVLIIFCFLLDFLKAIEKNQQDIQTLVLEKNEKPIPPKNPTEDIFSDY